VSFVVVSPDVLCAAAGDLAGIGEAMTAGNGAAASATAGVVAPGADAVSALTAARFGQHAQLYQHIAAQAAAVHEQLVATLRADAGGYAASEATNATTVD
jgi:hypothetical protein